MVLSFNGMAVLRSNYGACQSELSEQAVSAFIASATKLRSACRAPAQEWLPWPTRQSLFKNVLRLLIALRMLRANRNPTEVQLAQQPAHGSYIQRHGELCLDPLRKIDTPPAD